MSNWLEISSLIKDYQEIILVVHEKPDGDCLGSALALGLYLQGEGYQPLLYHAEPIAPHYDFLPGQELIKIEAGQNLPAGKPIIALDCADLSRISYDLPTNAPLLNLDHHYSNSLFGDFNLVDPTAAATGEIIFALLPREKITPEIATCLYVALSSDTGSFSYSNTTAQTFFIASQLLKQGAAIELIREHLFARRPLKELLMIKLALAKMQFALKGKVVWSVLSYQVLAEDDLLETDTESVISLLRSVEGVELALVFKELEAGRVKISFRSKKVCNVNLLAQEFGGGGHARAAGCSLEGNLTEITKNVIERIIVCLSEDGEACAWCP